MSCNVSLVVEDYITDASRASDIVEVLKAAALNDPSLCLEMVESIKKKIHATTEAEQLRAIELLDRLVDQFDMTLHQIVHEKNFLSFLEKVITSPTTSGKVVDRTKMVMTKWSRKFAQDEDIFPNFQIFFSRLVEQGFVDAMTAGQEKDQAQVMDTYLINEAEGQDPEEFKAEVKETLVLFNDVYNAIVKVSRMSKEDSISRREALISIAANLDRYAEQFGLWIEQLEPGEYMDEAIGLNEKVMDALDRYTMLRTGIVKGAPVDGEDSSSSDDYDDSSSDDSSD